MIGRRSARSLPLALSAALACAAALACGDGKTTSDATDTTATTTDTSPTTAPPTSSTTASSTTDSSTTDSSTTGVDVSGFERFQISRAAGPCPPDGDCDGFLELLASRSLRVEPFGAPPSDIIVVEISESDFAAAVAVFADPELTALLDAPDPLCDPPTDIFESMLVELEGATHDATTTTCPQPPIAAARAMAESLAMKYAP